MRKTYYVVLGALVTMAFGGFSASDDVTKAQKTEQARRIVGAEPYSSEIGALDDPYQFAHLSDEELEGQVGAAEQNVADAQGVHTRDYKALKNYEDRLVQEGETTRQELDMGLYEEPSGKLQSLQERQRVSARRVLDSQEAQFGVKLEKDLRENPEKFLAEEASLQADVAAGNQIAPFWMEKHEKMLAGDEEAWKYGKDVERRAGEVRMQAGLPVRDPPLFPEPTLLPGASVSHPQPSASLIPEETVFRIGEPRKLPPGTSTAPTKFDPSRATRAGPDNSITVTYRDLYGPDASPALIEQIEHHEIARLPAELKRGVPREVQRLFFYGGYEKMPRDQKKHLRHVVKQWKQEIKSRQDLQQAFGSAYDASQNALVPERLSNQTPANAASAAAYLLMQLTQKLLVDVTEATRRRKFEEALHKIEGEIPRGQRERVLFIEDVERRPEFTYGSIPGTLGVTAYRTNLDAIPEEQTLNLLGELDDLRQPSDAPHYHWYRFRRIYGVTIVGTGEQLGAKPTITEALQAGADMGRLARGRGLSMDRLLDIIRTSYARFREWEDICEAFRLAYGAQAQASDELSVVELRDLLNKRRGRQKPPAFDGKWRVKFGNWWILTIRESGGSVSGTIEADYEDYAQRRRKGIGTIKGERRQNVKIGKASRQDGIGGEIEMKRAINKWNPKRKTSDLVMVDHDLKKFQFRIEGGKRLLGEFCYQVGKPGTLRCRNANGSRILE